MKKEDDTLLAKWLEGNVTPSELQQLQQEVDLPALEQLLAQQKTFDLAIRPNEEMWQDFQKRLSKTPKKSSLNKPAWFIGGLVVLMMMIGLLWYYFNQNKNQKIETPPAKTEIKVYADGTKIHLSPKSRIEYNETTWTSQRKVNLDGQAFFEVEKGNPFVVTTAQGTIEVLGTQFDIWEMGTLMRVQCFEGNVKVTSGETSTVLKQNQQIIVNKNGLEKVEDIVDSQPDWMQDHRVYQKIPLRWVLKDLERFYGIKTDATTLSTQDDFGGIIPTNDLDKALDFLTKPINWTYEIKDKTIYFTAKKE